MIRAFRVDDIRAAEAAAMAEASRDGELMQRAARGLADALADIPAGRPGRRPGRARATTGATRCTRPSTCLDRGVRVDVAQLDPDRVHRPALDAAMAAGAQVVDGPSRQRWCLDGMFGIGARPGLSDRAAEWARVGLIR